jgi:DNA-3-methyladenine glycosylase II
LPRTIEPPRALTHATLGSGARALARRDPDLAELFRRHGMPPMWARRPGFATLIHIVLEQQVSIAAARTLFRRLSHQIGGMTPEAVAAHGVSRLRRFGLTRQKASYCHELALAVRDGHLNLGRIARAADTDGRESLLAMRGLGPWSVDIYYLMALRRPDVWPRGDLALAIAMRDVKRLSRKPGNAEQQEISAPWAPWRSVAARLLWHYYLSNRQSPINQE